MGGAEAGGLGEGVEEVAFGGGEVGGAEEGGDLVVGLSGVGGV